MQGTFYNIWDNSPACREVYILGGDAVYEIEYGDNERYFRG